MSKVCIIGVGMVPFTKPGESPEYNEMARDAVLNALKDAGIEYRDVQQAVVGYVYGDSTCGQRALYEVGMTGIPIINVNNNCSTGSTALFLARQLVEGGVADCVLALGFEKMEKGMLTAKFTDRLNPLDRHVEVMVNRQGFVPAPPAAQFFGGAGREYSEKYGVTKEQYAKISVKNRAHAQHNPYALFRKPVTLEEVLSSPEVFDPLTKFQCCPPTCGAAAAIVCSEAFAKKHGHSNPVYIAAQSMRTDFPSTFTENSMVKLVGYDMTRSAAEEVYNKAGIGPEDVDVIELHDCFTTNEMITYEALGLCREGDAARLIEDGEVTYEGKWVVNPSGGLLSKGHPLGATGLAQCAELVWQLRGHAEKRQVEGARIALQHNIGLGGAVVVTLYRRD
jgi:acetyl-CoA acetyltransferase